MRLVTWNCASSSLEKIQGRLDELQYDVAVLQEVPMFPSEAGSRIWCGGKRTKGVAVLARGKYQVEMLPENPEGPIYAYPVKVTGPVPLNLLAVCGRLERRDGSTRGYSYTKSMLAALEVYEEFLSSGNGVMIGDFNSGARWDKKWKPNNHSYLVGRLKDGPGLVSAYHEYHGEAQDGESRPTFYQYGHEDKPYHIDYCFLPEAWMPRVKDVTVGSFAGWKGLSDHRPLVVEVA